MKANLFKSNDPIKRPFCYGLSQTGEKARWFCRIKGARYELGKLAKSGFSTTDETR